MRLTYVGIFAVYLSNAILLSTSFCKQPSVYHVYDFKNVQLRTIVKEFWLSSQCCRARS